jgi:uncharacterized membrane protein YfcA
VELVSWPMITILMGVGIGVGLISGLMGIAGGVILVPALLKIEYVLGVPSDTAVKVAFGTSLLTGFLTSLSGTWQHHRERNVCWRDALALSLAGTAGALFGSTLSAYLTASVLKPLFGVVVLVVSVILALRSDSKENVRSERHPVGLMVFVGALIGILSALVGIGGGVMLVPFLALALGYPPRRAVGTSGAVIPLIALFGAAGYIVHGWGMKDLLPYSAGYVNLFFVLCLSVTSMLVAPLGAKIGTKLQGKWLNRLFALMLVFVALKMIGMT